MSASVTSYPDRRVIAKGDRTKVCSRCGWSNVRPSPRRGAVEFVLAWFWLAPFRCRNCRHRFFRFSGRNAGLAGPVSAAPLKVIPRRRQPQAEESARIQPSPVKAELRAWALGGPVAPEEHAPKHVKAPVYAFSPPPLEVLEAPVGQTAIEEIPKDQPSIEKAEAQAPVVEAPIVEIPIVATDYIEAPAIEEVAPDEAIEESAIDVADVETEDHHEAPAIETRCPEMPLVEETSMTVAVDAALFQTPSSFAELAAEPPIEEAPTEETHSILILDREEPIRKLLRRILERQGYRVREMGNSRELTSELLPGSVDLLITDPEEQLESVEAMHDIYPDMRIIVLSNSWDGELATCAVIQKPFRTEVLLESVRNALG